jgi:hydroxymethylglutaryl-CoA reductase
MYQTGRQVLVNFGYFTGDAQGMNMLVKATDHACQWIQKNYPGTTYLSSAACARRSGRPDSC